MTRQELFKRNKLAHLNATIERIQLQADGPNGYRRNASAQAAVNQGLSMLRERIQELEAMDANDVYQAATNDERWLHLREP